MRAARLLGLRLGVLRQFSPRPVRPIRLPLLSASTASLPTISIVTPAMNMSAFVEQTIGSVLEQHYPTLEYVVMDGGSTDGTAEAVRRHASSLLHFESGPDGGQAAAINSGFRLTAGEVMGWLNADDLLLPGALHFVGAYFRDHPAIDVIYGHRLLIDEHGAEIGRWVLPSHDEAAFRWFDFVPQETLFWRRDVWNRLGGLNADFQFAMDWDLLLRMRRIGVRFARVPYYLGAFRVHPDQKTLALSETGNSEIERLRVTCAEEVDWQPRQLRSVGWYVLKHIAINNYYRLRGWA
jgi:glycosyltransferase involved in cell wall biosynthesis